MSDVKKVIIPAAGWGTRFLPLTKVVHKELIPILNKPIIHYLVEEAAAAKLEEVILIISPRKKEILNYFNINKKLENLLASEGKIELLHKVKKTSNIIKIKVAIQKEQKGLAHAIYTGIKFIDKEPFAVILGDDLIASNTPPIKQLMDSYNKYKTDIIAVQKVSISETKRYGIVIQGDNIEKNIFKIKGAVEKPDSNPPSIFAIVGRYVFKPVMADILKKINWSKSSEEVNLVDIFNEKNNVYAQKINGNMYDIGSIEGFVKATIDFALKDKEIGESIRTFIKNK